MDVMQAIRTRRSIRKYQDRPVESQKLHQLLEAARLAPSASNRQNWKLVVITDAATRKKMVKACYEQAFIAQAPVLIVACATDAQRIMRSGLQAAAVDPTIAVDHMTLAAVELELGSCWIGAFDPQQVAEIINLPEGVIPAHVLTVGYPDEDPTPRPRKATDEIICRETFHQ